MTSEVLRVGFEKQQTAKATKKAVSRSPSVARASRDLAAVPEAATFSAAAAEAFAVSEEAPPRAAAAAAIEEQFGGSRRLAVARAAPVPKSPIMSQGRGVATLVSEPASASPDAAAAAAPAMALSRSQSATSARSSASGGAGG